MKIKNIIDCLEELAPLYLQESYDNSGLLVGDFNSKVKGALISLDCTESVIDEAISLGINLVISHHPIIFSPLKKINGKNYYACCMDRIFNRFYHDIVRVRL